jgi:hypothetical protein
MVIADGSEILTNPKHPIMHLYDTDDKEDMEPKIVEIYWCHSKEQRRLTTDDSRHHVDLSLHIETENYDDGDTINMSLEANYGNTSKDKIPIECKLNGTAFDNKIVIENIFREFLDI